MLEDPRLLIQIGSLIVTLTAGWVMIRSSLGTAQRDLRNLETTFKENMNDLHGRVDKIEQDKGVLVRQAEVFSSILSPKELQTTHREMGALLNRVSHLEGDLKAFKDNYDKSHNNAHKYVPPPKGT
jgi:DNA anti-recombination protein RmuC